LKGILPVATDTRLDNVLRHFEGTPKASGSGYTVRCPAHDDATESLTVHVSDRDGKILLHCQAGCDFEVVREAAGLSHADLAAPGSDRPRRSNNAPRTTEEILSWPSTVATYEYRDAEGQPAFLVVKKQDPEGRKSFRQYRVDTPGYWRSGMNGTTRTIYRLPDVVAAIQAGQTIYVVEGEKDVEALVALGLVATTNPGGAGKWRPEFSMYFSGARVVLLPDNDEPGHRHAEIVARSLQGIAAEVRVLELPDLPPKGDVSDWLSLGGSREKLEALLVDVPAKEPPAKLNEPEELTDLGNARRLVARHGEDLRHCQALGWLAWDGCRFAIDDTGEVMRRAKAVSLSWYEDAADPTLTGKHRDELLEHGKRSQSVNRIRAMVSLAESEPGIPVSVDALDRDPWLLCVLNGTLDLRTGKLHPPRREDLSTRLAPVAYDPEAKCPTWDEYLTFVMEGDGEMIAFLRRAVGYSLTGDTRERALFMHYGGGRNGKSTFLETLALMLGDGYCAHAPHDTFMAKQTETHPTEIARMRGARLVVAAETEQGRRLSEVLVKQVTGRDKLTARFMRRDFFEFYATFKLHFATNHRPVVRDTTHSIWDRIRLVPWARRIEKHEEDKDLPQRLAEELPGILAWAVRGCLEWQQKGLASPDTVMMATQTYQHDEDSLAPFLDECCVVHTEARVKVSALFEVYRRWAKAAGERELGMRQLSHRVRERGYKTRRAGANGAYLFFGIGLRADQVDQDDARAGRDPDETEVREL